MVKQIIFGALGGFLALLGLLWFLQGSDLVHIKPILCVANCEVVQGGSLLWQIIGAVMFALGVFVVCKFAADLKNFRK